MPLTWNHRAICPFLAQSEKAHTNKYSPQSKNTSTYCSHAYWLFISTFQQCAVQQSHWIASGRTRKSWSWEDKRWLPNFGRYKLKLTQQRTARARPTTVTADVRHTEVDGQAASRRNGKNAKRLDYFVLKPVSKAASKKWHTNTFPFDNVMYL